MAQDIKTAFFDIDGTLTSFVTHVVPQSTVDALHALQRNGAFFNKESDVAKLREGETFLVSVNIESREYNGRWYTDIRAWRVQPKQQQPPVPMTDAPLPSDIPAEGGSFGGGAAAEVDDLPF